MGLWHVLFSYYNRSVVINPTTADLHVVYCQYYNRMCYPQCCTLFPNTVLVSQLRLMSNRDTEKKKITFTLRNKTFGFFNSTILVLWWHDVAADGSIMFFKVSCEQWLKKHVTKSGFKYVRHTTMCCCFWEAVKFRKKTKILVDLAGQLVTADFSLWARETRCFYTERVIWIAQG